EPAARVHLHPPRTAVAGRSAQPKRDRLPGPEHDPGDPVAAADRRHALVDSALRSRDRHPGGAGSGQLSRRKIESASASFRPPRSSSRQERRMPNSYRAQTTTGTFRQSCSIRCDIHAPAETVWALLTDASGFTRWNSTVTSIDGEIAPGRKLAIKVPLDPKRTFKPKVTRFEPGREMVWSD